MKRKLLISAAIGMLCISPSTAYASDSVSQQSDVDMDSLSEEEYKEKCTEMWYEDITFSKEDLEGEYVKVDLYVEDQGIMDPYNSLIYDKIKEYNLSTSCCLTGIYSKDTDSYGSGGDVGIMFSDDYGFKSSDYVPGTYLTIYGKIIDYGIDRWSGHNSAWFMPKYIENVRNVK